MRKLADIAKNTQVTALFCVCGYLCGFVRLNSSGKPMEYSMIVAENEEGLEHASISCMDPSYIPGWGELCELKDIVWQDEEECYQIFPKKSEYMNIVDNCMHIWRRRTE